MKSTKRYDYWDRDDPGPWSTAMVIGVAAVVAIILLLAGCATAPLPLGHWRESPRPCWYDKSRGPGTPYKDAEGTYYIGKDYASNSYFKIRGGNTPRNPYVYQPGTAYWNKVYMFNVYRPYLTPNCRKR